MCPECGQRFVLEELIPEGATPALIVGGRYLGYTTPALALLDRYRLPWVRIADPMQVLNHPGIDADRHARIGVGPADYFTAIDLLRRAALDEPLPPPPAGPVDDTQWPCPACTEESPANFEVCWNCGAPRDAG